jgi:diaminopimelate epimerase
MDSTHSMHSTYSIHYDIYSGAGNDFVMIDNTDNSVPFEKQQDFVKKICSEKFIEIDGVIFVDKAVANGSSIRMNYYNRDGSYGAMCGNGARCISLFAIDNKIMNEKEFNIEAVGNLYKAEILKDGLIRIYFPPPQEYKLNSKVQFDFDSIKGTINVHWIHVGSEHLVIFIDEEQNRKVFSIDNLNDAKINEWGSPLRFHKVFQPEGANVNFVQILSANELRIRTYERGVERETLACGTGIISSAIISSLVKGMNPPIRVLTQSKEYLTVDFKVDDSKIYDITLKGPAKKISEGEINL